MTQDKSKKEDFEEFKQEVLDAVDEAFDEATGEVANILKDYIGSSENNELHRKQKNTIKNDK